MKENVKEKFALGIFIFSLVVLLVLVFMALQTPRNEITGKIIEDVGKEAEEVEELKITCADSDGGKDYSVKGVVDFCDSSGCSSIEDSCSGKKLIEWYCKNNEKNYEEHNCEFDCDNRVCIALVKNYQYIGGGGGGGGGSSVTTSTPTTVESGETYNLGELGLEHTLEVVKNDIIKFSITGREYILTLKDNTEAQVTITINNQEHAIDVGKDKNIDLDSDGISDIYIKISSINTITHKVKLILRLA